MYFLVVVKLRMNQVLENSETIVLPQLPNTRLFYHNSMEMQKSQ